MSRSWNGLKLVDEFSAALGDTSTAFKSKVLGWLNDGIFDIATKNDLRHFLVKGKKLLTADEEFQNLEITPPEAPDVELADDGDLSNGSSYRVLVTFTQSNGVESQAGEISDEVTCDADSKTIEVTNIPTSLESLITGRKVYLSKDDGPFYFVTELDDSETSLTIDEDTDSTIEPPDYDSIRKLSGSPFFEDSPSVYLQHRDYDQLRMLVQGQWSIGNPEYFASLDDNRIALYPIPANEFDLSFTYYRNPFRLYYSEDSQPDLPVRYKPALKAYVIAAGYEYRDRDGAELKRANFRNERDEALNGGKPANVEYVVRDVNGSAFGMEIG